MRLVIDTETCPIDVTVETVDANNMWTYDCGWAVVDDNGAVIVERSFVNADIFLGERELMKSAYFADKIPQYWEDIKSGKRVLTSWYKIRKTLLDDIKQYHIKQVFAHNMRFDYATLNQTQRWLTKSKSRRFFPYGVQICDTLKMSREVLRDSAEYRDFCFENGYITRNNQLRFTAEILYRFITGLNDFEESHTALEDALIEKEIMTYCFKMKSDVVSGLWG